jgi:hypothetical protein
VRVESASEDSCPNGRTMRKYQIWVEVPEEAFVDQGKSDSL